MQSLNPLVSVITPVYKSASTLAATLKSLQKQDETSWESIVIDDGSPDSSRAIAEEMSRADRHIRVLSQPNRGACAARNTGLAVAQGRYVLFLDADDLMEPHALSAMTSACEKKNWAGVHGTFRHARPDGTPTEWIGRHDVSGLLFETLASSNVLALPSCAMIRRSLLAEIGGGFDTTLTNCGDWDLWARVARTDCKIGFIDECVTDYRMQRSSLSRNPLTLLRDATIVMKRMHTRDPRVTRPHRQCAAGSNPRELPGRIAGFTFYAASLAAMQGHTDAAEVALNTIQNWPLLPARRIAEFLLHAACFSRCTPPDDLHPLPEPVLAVMDRMVAAMERRTGTSKLQATVNAALTSLGFSRETAEARQADRARLERPRAATDTLALEYLRSLALRECVAG